MSASASAAPDAWDCESVDALRLCMSAIAKSFAFYVLTMLSSSAHWRITAHVSTGYKTSISRVSG